MARHLRSGRALGAGMALAMAAAGIPLLAAANLAAASTLGSYSVAAQAPVWQFTYDFPQANFHPQADSELTYAESDLDPTRSHALSSVAWPGAAGGNLGALIAVLGGPTVNALNDPVRAEAFSSGTTHQVTGAPSGTTMEASAAPSGNNAQEATATTATGGTSLGQGGALGSSSAKTDISIDQTGRLAATAVSNVDNIDIAGVFKAASLMSSAREESVGGNTPTGSSELAVHDLTIAGQQAYVDGSGVHVGSPGQPPNPAINAIVNKALAGFGMQIYFTAPQQVKIANYTYDYAASILVVWIPPSDSHGDYFTFSFGGAAVAMEAGQGASGLPSLSGVPPIAAAPTPDSGAGSVPVVPPSPATPALSLPSAPAPAVPATRSASRPVTQLAAPASATAAGSPAVPTAWYLLLVLAVIAGAALMTRVPGLLTAGAAARCRDEHPWSTDRST
jgi:hypothetical protein